MTPWLKLREKLENCIDDADHIIGQARKLTRHPDSVAKHQIYKECYQFILSYMKVLDEDAKRGFAVEDEAQ